MATNPYVNKVEYGGNTLIDLTGDTVTPNALLQGYTAHGASGAPINGALVQPISISGATVTLIPNTFVYDGTEKTQDVASVVLNGTTLAEGTDYVVTGNAHTNAGTYALNILGVNAYNGAIAVSWSIAKAQSSISVSPSSISIMGSGNTDTATITHTGDGTVSVSSSDSTVATATINGDIVTVTSVAGGSATITVTLAEGDNYLGATCTISATVVPVHVYGVSWDGTSTTAWTRTDEAAAFTDPVPYVSGATVYGSPFDNCMPWSGMEIVEDSEAGTLVAIPKFWYKLEQNGAGMKIQIAENELDGFSVSPAHMDRGDGKGERNMAYIGRYHCGATAYKSASGQKPKASVTRANFRTNIHNLGSTIWQADLAMRFTIFLLYLVEFADWNSQANIGCGCGNGSGTQNMGYTDSMPYHTGTTQSSRTRLSLGTQYRYIEGLWDNVFDWEDGCYNNSSGLNLILNPTNFSDSSGGVNVGRLSSGFPSAFSVNEINGTFPLFIPSAANGSSSTYSCDHWYFSASNRCVSAGGSYGQSLASGLFCFQYNNATSTSDRIGSRLMKLP